MKLLEIKQNMRQFICAATNLSSITSTANIAEVIIKNIPGKISRVALYTNV
jgi:hypothetical protein